VLQALRVLGKFAEAKKSECTESLKKLKLRVALAAATSAQADPKAMDAKALKEAVRAIARSLEVRPPSPCATHWHLPV
jgi:hypothetical protein